jgi:uncharacterized protein
LNVRYEWDEAKNRSNRAKHGLDFADAERVFSGRCVSFIDARFDYGEKRLVTLGMLAGRVVVMAHAPRGHEVTRIISMRKANGREQKIYQKRLSET